MRLERARETHEVLDVNRKAMKYRRANVQTSRTPAFMRQGPSRVLDEEAKQVNVANVPPMSASDAGQRQSQGRGQGGSMGEIGNPDSNAEEGAATGATTMGSGVAVVDEDSDASYVGCEHSWAVSPGGKFWLHSTSRLLLTVLHASVAVSQNSLEWDWMEVLFYVWMLAQFSEDVVGLYY